MNALLISYRNAPQSCLEGLNSVPVEFGGQTAKSAVVARVEYRISSSRWREAWSSRLLMVARLKRLDDKVSQRTAGR
jgi:hypothetical protein